MNTERNPLRDSGANNNTTWKKLGGGVVSRAIVKGGRGGRLFKYKIVFTHLFMMVK